MSTTIAMSKYWADFRQQLSGAGTISIDADGQRATCTAGAGDVAYVKKFIPARAGEIVKFSFLARRISGEPKAAINYPAAGDSQSVVDIDSDEIIEYTVSYIVPYTNDEGADYLQLSLGTFTSEAGSCEVVNPRIQVSDGSLGFMRVWCAGLIELTRAGGVTTAAIDDTHMNCGIKSVDWDSSTKVLTIEMLKSPNQSLALRPMLGAEFRLGLLPELFTKAGNYQQTSGEFDISFYDGGSSTVDVNSLLTNGETVFVSVWAFGI